MSIPPQIIREEMQNNWGIELQDIVSVLVFMILALSSSLTYSTSS